jgi:hypothetical protein
MSNLEETPYVAFGNDELAAKPNIGPTVKCQVCGEMHDVRDHAGVIATYHCPKSGKSYLCAVDGKDITAR